MTILNMAETMYEIFEGEAIVLNGETMISAEGLRGLTEYFDDIDVEDRGAVWEEFLSLLYHADWIEDINSFIHTVGNA